MISLGYTTNNYYTYTAAPGANYTFVVKSAYSIFKDNMSSGLTISVETNMDSNIGDIVDPGGSDDDTTDDDKPPIDTGLE